MLDQNRPNLLRVTADITSIEPATSGPNLSNPNFESDQTYYLLKITPRSVSAARITQVYITASQVQSIPFISQNQSLMLSLQQGKTIETNFILLNSNFQIDPQDVIVINNISTYRLVSWVKPRPDAKPAKAVAQTQADKTTTKAPPYEAIPPADPLFSPIPAPPIRNGQTRIGYAVLDVPIHHISQTRMTHVEQQPVLRSTGTIKKGLGHAVEQYSINWTAHGVQGIQSSVRDVLEQIRLVPFLPVEGGPFPYLTEVTGESDAAIPYQAIAIRSFSISTVDGLPNTLEVQMNFEPFLWEWFTPLNSGPEQPTTDNFPRLKFEDMFCWPVFKLWAKTRKRSVYHEQPFNGHFSIWFPSPDLDDEITFLMAQNTAPNNVIDLGALTGFRNILHKREAYTPFVKEIFQSSNRTDEALNISGNQPRYLVLKVGSKTTWDALQDRIKHRRIASFVGWMFWDRLSGTTFADDDGTFLPTASNNVSIDWISSAFAEGSPTVETKILSPNIADIVPEWESNSSFNSQAAAMASRVPATINNENPAETLTRKWQASPWAYFAFLFRVDNRTSQNELDQMIAEIQTKLKQGGRETYSSLNDRLASVFRTDSNAPSLLGMMAGSPSHPENNPDIIVERIGATQGHNISSFSGQTDPLPLHQYVGGIDCTIVVQGKAFGTENKKRIERIKDEFDDRALNRTSGRLVTDERRHALNKRGAAYVRVDNEIFQLMGIDFAVPVALEISIVDGQPDVWNWTMTFVEYDVATKQQEYVKFLDTTMQKMGRAYSYGLWDSLGKTSPIVDRARDWFSLQASLSQVEAYQDLALPTRSELNDWIELCRLAAIQYEKTKTTAVPGYSAEMVNHIRPYLTHYSRSIKKWKSTEADAYLPGAYVEPDFYCYYDPNQSWEALFDATAEQLMGKPDPATGQAMGHQPNPNVNGDVIGEKPPTEAQVTTSDTKGGKFTITDNTHRVVTNMENQFYALKDFDKMNEVVLASRTYPENRRTLFELSQQADAKFDTQWQHKIWWAERNQDSAYLSVGNDPNVAIIGGQDEERIFNRQIDQLLSPKGIGPDGQPIEDGTLQFRRDPNFSWYFNVLIRERMANLAMEGNLPFPEKTSVTPSETFFLHNGELERTVRIVQKLNYPIGSKQFLTAYITQVLKEFHNPPTLTSPGEALSPDARLMPDAGGLSQIPNQFATPKISWLSLTHSINRNFRNLNINSKVQYSFEGLGARDSANGRIVQSWRFFDLVGKRFGTDPNLLRAVFLKRDGLGKFNPAGTPETSFGDFDLKALNRIPAPSWVQSDSGKAIVQFADHYVHWKVKLGNRPSLILLALSMSLQTIPRRRYYVDDEKMLPEVLADLMACAKLSGKAYFDKLKVLIAKYRDASALIDQYYVAYISLCRTYGSYAIGINSIDPYFNSLSPFVLMDVGNNTKAYFSTTVAPSRERVLLDGHRDEVRVLPAEDRRFKRDDESAPFKGAELAARRAKALASALEPRSETSIYGHLADLRKYGKFGRLAQAYPTYQILLINEGFFWLAGNKKLWDQYYTRTGVSSIEVFRTKTDPAATCTITFSNMFHRISAYNQQEAMMQAFARHEQEKIGEYVGFPGGEIGTPLPINAMANIGNFWDLLFTKDTKEELVRIWQNNHLQQLALNVGTRIQVRMGYGSNCAELPVVFNGSVVSAPVDEGYVTLVCVSDGSELKNNSTTKLVKSGNAYAFSDGGAFGIGKDPSSIITEALVSGGTWDTVLQGNFRDWSHGIAHFGNVYYEGLKYYPAELQINIYSSNPTTLEQGLPSIQNYFNFAALYNYNSSFLFSIEVQEPNLWKVLSVCKNACIDFVGSAEWFADRSTVFFGKWWWPYHYAYHPDILLSGKLGPFGSQDNNPTVSVDAHLTQIPNNPVVNSDQSGERTDAGDPIALLRANAVLQHDLDPIHAWNPLYIIKIGADRAFGGDHDAKGKIQRFWPQYYPLTELPQTILLDVLERYPTIKSRGVLSVQKSSITGFTEYLIFYVPDGVHASQAPAVYYATLNQIAAFTREELTAEEAQEILNGKRTSTLIQNVRKTFATWIEITPANPLLKALATIPPAWNAIVNSAQSNFEDVVEPESYDFIRDVKELTQYLKWKPYCQVYFAHSMINLLQNSIVADKTYVYTDAQGMHTYNGWISGDSMVRTLTYCMDSIPGYVPVTIRDKNGLIDILPIEDLCPQIPTDSTKQRWFDQDYEVLDKTGWTKVKGFMAHRTTKSIYSVNGHTGLVDLTEDHCLFVDGEFDSPADSLNKTIQTISIPKTDKANQIDLDVALFYGAFVAEGTAGRYKRTNGTINYQFKIVESDADWLAKVGKGLTKLGYEWKIVKNPSDQVYTLTLNTSRKRKGLTKQKLVEHLIDACYCKVRKEKRVPKAILNSNWESKEAFLVGYMEGDGIKGYHTGQRSITKPFPSVESRDYTLMAQISYLIQDLTDNDVSILVSTKKRSTGFKDYYRITARDNHGKGKSWRKPSNVVKSVKLASRQEEVVYDLHTESGTFGAGINNVLIHNSDIQPSERRTMLVDTGIVTTGMQEGLSRSLAEGALTIAGYSPLVGGAFNTAREFIQKAPSTPAIENAVVNALCESGKEMYQGWFTIMGQPTIKPRDLIFLNDHILDMRGPLFVKEVIHRMDTDTGFLTMVSPDAVVLPHSAEMGTRLIQSLATGLLHRVTSFYAFKAVSAALWGSIGVRNARKAHLGQAEGYRRYASVLERVQSDEFKHLIPDARDRMVKKLTDDYNRDQKALAENKDLTPEARAEKAKEIEEAYHRRSAKLIAIPFTPEELHEFLREERLLSYLNDKDIVPKGSELEWKILFREIELQERKRELIELYEAGELLRANISPEEIALIAEREYVAGAAGFADSNFDELGLRTPPIDSAQSQLRISRLLDDLADADRANDYARKATILREMELEFSRLAASGQRSLSFDVRRAYNQWRLQTLAVQPEVKGALVRILDETFGSTVTAAKTLGGVIEGAGEGLTRVFSPRGHIAYMLKRMAAAKAFFKSFKGSGKEKIADAWKLFSESVKDVWSPKAVKAGREIVTGARILSYTNPLGWIKLLLDASIFIVGGEVIGSISSHLRARQAVKIIPLMVGDRPFTAGIRGHAGAVIGDDASWVDKFWTNALSLDSVWSAKGATYLALSVLTPFDMMNIEVPSYTSASWIDQEALNILRDQQAELKDTAGIR